MITIKIIFYLSINNIFRLISISYLINRWKKRYIVFCNFRRFPSFEDYRKVIIFFYAFIFLLILFILKNYDKKFLIIVFVTLVINYYYPLFVLLLKTIFFWKKPTANCLFITFVTIINSNNWSINKTSGLTYF